MEQNNQEIDYKAEYEKMMAEKEREEVVNNFKKAMDEEGYEFDEETFSNNSSNYNNDELKKFSEMFKALKPKSNHPFKIGISQRENQYHEQPKATFEDYINGKKN